MSTRARGIWRIDEEDLAHALKLPDGQRVISVYANWSALSIDLMISGPGMPEPKLGYTPPVVGRGLPDAGLKRRVGALADELQQIADSWSSVDDRKEHAYLDSAERLRGLLK